MPVIEVDELTKSYDGKTVVEDVAAIERVESGRPRGKVTIRIATPSDESLSNTRRAEEGSLTIGAER